jgi:hypothetical protein
MREQTHWERDRQKPRGRAIWHMSDFKAAVFMLAVALMVALFTTVTW